MKKFVGVKEIAALLGVRVSWIYSRTRTNTIPFIKVGKYNRFDPDEVIQWFRGGTDGQEA